MFLKKALMITYHFPPSAASGAFRMLGFARHLPTFGWQPLVVAPPSMPWEPIDPALADGLPDDAVLEQVPYPSAAPRLLRMVAPNAIWLPRAWARCVQVIREHGPDVILTSGPPHCVHALGYYLKRMTGLPWIADFRDPWISAGARRRWSVSRWWQRRWEKGVFDNADLIVANAPNACQLYRDAYPGRADRIVTVTNGFDPRIFDAPALTCGNQSNVVRLLHAGEIYAGRDPLPLLEALACVNQSGAQRFELEILGRSETPLAELLRTRGWDDFVALEGQRPYEQTLDAMAAADILVLFDSPGRKIGVPAKLYEYFGAGRPILALAEPDGDTAAILRQSGVPHRIASLTSPGLIAAALHELVELLDDTEVNPAALEPFTRASIARSLAGHMDRLIGCADAYELSMPEGEIVEARS